MRLCDSWIALDVPSAERRPRERRVDVELVDAVPELVHRREQRSEIAFVGVRREADVAEVRAWRQRDAASRRAARTSGRSRTPRARGAPCLLLALDRERAVDLLDSIPSRAARRAARARPFRRPKISSTCAVVDPFLVLVEQNVVRLVGLRETRDVAMLELELPLEVRAEGFEVRGGFRLVPRGHRHAARLRHLAGQLRWDPARSLPLTPGDSDQRSLDGVGILACSVQVVEELRRPRPRRSAACARRVTVAATSARASAPS